MVTACGQALSPLPTYTLSLVLSVIELCKTLHQCGVCIGLYTLSSRRGLRMGCRIVKGVSKRCVSRLLLTVRCDIHTTHEIGKNGKQYLNIVQVCLHFVQQKYMIIITTAIHTIIIITCTTYSIAEISFKSSKVSSSFGKFIVNSGRYVLPI